MSGYGSFASIASQMPASPPPSQVSTMRPRASRRMKCGWYVAPSRRARARSGSCIDCPRPVVALDERAGVVRRVRDVDPDVCDLRVALDVLGVGDRLALARASPGRPDVDQHRPAAEVAERDRLALQRRARDIRCRLSAALDRRLSVVVGVATVESPSAGATSRRRAATSATTTAARAIASANCSPGVRSSRGFHLLESFGFDALAPIRDMVRRLAIVLVFVVLGATGTASGAPKPPAPFAAEQIATVVDAGLMAPSVAAFRPKDPLTETEFAVVLASLGVPVAVSDPYRPVTVRELDARLVSLVGLRPAAMQIRLAAAQRRSRARSRGSEPRRLPGCSACASTTSGTARRSSYSSRSLRRGPKLPTPSRGCSL